MLTLNLNANCNANANRTLNLTLNGKVWKVLNKVKKKKRKVVSEVKVKLKSNGIPNVKHNHYATSSMSNQAFSSICIMPQDRMFD